MGYRSMKFVLSPLLQVGFRPWVEGLENIPSDGAAIMASNHLSFSDSLFLPLVCPRKITFLAKSEYFTEKGVRGRAKRWFMESAGQVPVERSGGRASEAALITGLRVLSTGELLGIYPEGTRSPDGRLYRGHTGIARLVLEGRVPVVPCGMIDTDKVQPTGQKLPNFGKRPGIRIGKPLDFSRYFGVTGDRFVLRSVTDEIMYELMQLTGQEYVDVYASRVKADIESRRRDSRADGENVTVGVGRS